MSQFGLNWPAQGRSRLIASAVFAGTDNEGKRRPMQLAHRLIAAILLLGAAAPAMADDGVVSVRYDMSVSGFPIGSAKLSALIRNDNYRVEVTAKVGGLLALVSDGRGAATANGRISSEYARATSYSLSSSGNNRTTMVKMAMGGGSIRDLAIDPVPAPRPDRIPVTAAHRRGVVDPVSALLMPVSGKGPLLTAEACDRNLPVFDGAQRYDVTLSYSRMEKVNGGEGGYKGDAVVCKARYTPIAGHRERREQTRYMAKNNDMEVWLVPIEGTRVLAPFRIAVATPSGRLVIAASRFETSVPTMSADAN